MFEIGESTELLPPNAEAGAFGVDDERSGWVKRAVEEEQEAGSVGAEWQDEDGALGLRNGGRRRGVEDDDSYFDVDDDDEDDEDDFGADDTDEEEEDDFDEFDDEAVEDE